MQLSEFTYVFLILCVPFIGYIVKTTNPKKGFTILFSSIIFLAVFIGEDGPTHQPVEHLMSLRLIPGVDVIRPANSIEAQYAYQYIFSQSNNPKSLVLTRQSLDYVETKLSYKNFQEGAYELINGDDITIFASGSEVNLAIEVSKKLKKKSVQVISTPILNQVNTDTLTNLKINEFVFTLELGRSIGWQDYIGKVTESFSIETFGKSAPLEDLTNYFEFSAEKIAEKILQNNSNDDYLLLLEHDGVITSGRSAKKNNLLVSEEELNNRGIDFFETDRGGDITYHGEGQLIGYPIVRMSDPKKILPFVRSLENVIIDSLKEFSIDSYTKEDDTGVWTSGGKIASIGIKVSKWTTYHGFSLNIFDNLEGFNLINPCGNESEQMSSIHQFNNQISFEDVSSVISKNFENIFNYEKTDQHFSQFTPKQLKTTKEFNIDEMVKRGVFKPNKNIIPILYGNLGFFITWRRRF